MRSMFGLEYLVVLDTSGVCYCHCSRVKCVDGCVVCMNRHDVSTTAMNLVCGVIGKWLLPRAYLIVCCTISYDEWRTIGC